MKRVVVDSNVAVVANGRNVHVDDGCQLACISELEEVVKRYQITVDKEYLIFKEYQNHLNFSGGPGTGDMFFKHLFDHLYNPRHVSRVKITESGDDRGFEELPPNRLDPSDRKFLAVAVVGQAPILNATDGDWYEHCDFIQGMGVEIIQLCPEFAR